MDIYQQIDAITENQHFAFRFKTLAPMNLVYSILKGMNPLRKIYFREQVSNSVAKVMVMPYLSQGHGVALQRNLHSFG